MQRRDNRSLLPPHPRSRRGTAARRLCTTLALLLVTGQVLAAEPPLSISVDCERDVVEVGFVLVQKLPESIATALASGAHVRVVYPVRVRAKRRLLWDRRLWSGEVSSSVAFDPVTGRYRCETSLDEVIIASEETRSAEVAGRWLTAPPPVKVTVPGGRRPTVLLVRVRAIFSSSTKWLLFPSTEGTDWVETVVEPRE